MTENDSRRIFFPKTLIVEGRAAGKVEVTRHGWLRFLQRGNLPAGRSYAHYLYCLQQSFDRARKVKIRPELRVRRKRRHGESQQYFYDQEMNIWYVVLPKEGWLVTVVTDMETGRNDTSRTGEQYV